MGSRAFVAGVLFAIVALVMACAAQDVHIVPRSQPADKNSADILDTHTKAIRSNVDLVMVPVTVTDGMDRIVTGLEKENFAVYEDKRPQPISNVATDDAPVSVGIIFDMSGSMGDKFDRATEAVGRFLDTANPQDEFFLIAFSDKPVLLSRFTSDVSKVKASLLGLQPSGRTALLDSVYLGIATMKQAKYPRKALLIISDGGDNRSRYTESEIKSVVEEADTQLFSIGLFDAAPSTVEEQFGPELLGELTDVTGGRTFDVGNINDLADVAEKIGIELRNEYILTYKPDQKPHDGKWHKIMVKLHPPKGVPELHVVAKKGFYAAER